MTEKPNYVEMDGPTMVQECGADGMMWAEAFCQIKKAQGWSTDDIDEGVMVAWFANAIETACQVRQRAA